MTEETSQRINFLKFVCAILVVCIHSCNPPNAPWSFSWFLGVLFLQWGLPRIAVPFFFLCSGYFLAKHLDSPSDWWVAVRKRVRTLVVPFCIWLVISGIVIPFGIHLCADVLKGDSACGATIGFFREFDWFGFVDYFFLRTPITPLWYLKSLFLFVLAAPLIVSIVRRLGWKWLVICFVLDIISYLPSSPLPSSFFYRLFDLQGLFYFTVGIYLYNGKDLVNPFERGGIFCAIIAVMLSVAKLFIFAKGYEAYWSLIEELIIPFMLSAIWLLTPVVRLPKWLEDMSFPIYIMHISIFLVLNPILLQIPFLGHLSRGTIRLFVGVVGPILLAHLLRRYCPRFAKLAFGER